MRKDEKLMQELNKPLDPSLVKEREGAEGRVLSYIEGHVIIRHLNRIFGYGGWSYELKSLKMMAEFKDDKGRLNVGYMAIVSLVIYYPHEEGTREVVREDVGYGTGVGKTPNSAHESAIKEAVTDALKRCARTWGAQFGLELYGSGFKGNNGDKGEPPTERQTAFLQKLLEEQGLDEHDLNAHALEVYEWEPPFTRRQVSRLIEDLKAGKVEPLDEAFPKEERNE